jgi:predicted TIM-barrel fold metal-dependent hydrolase
VAADAGVQSRQRQPVIDVHVHVYATDARWKARVPNPATGAPLREVTESEHRLATLEQLRRFNVVRAVISDGNAPTSPAVARWQAEAPGKLIPAIAFSAPDEVSPEWIRAEHRAGRVAVIGEIGAPYAGFSAGDSAYEAYFALAEELDIPIAVHMGSAGGQATYNGSPKYRMELNRPLRLEDVLARHPRARVQVMHAGWPFADEMVALMKAHPQVYVDLGVINWTQPRAEFHAYLRRLVDAGLGKRIMFGSDQMVWAEAIGLAIAAVEEAPFLTDDQERDILCRNAAEFLRLGKDVCVLPTR